jgi:uncharacterized lipoprotein YmbA
MKKVTSSLAALAAIAALGLAGCASPASPQQFNPVPAPSQTPSQTPSAAPKPTPKPKPSASEWTADEEIFWTDVEERTSYSKSLKGEAIKIGHKTCAELESELNAGVSINKTLDRVSADADGETLVIAAATYLCDYGSEVESYYAAKSMPAKREPAMTQSQEQAVGKAADYLETSHFSKKGLIKQLKFEGFSRHDAEFGVAHVEVNWKEQAAGKAKDYLEYTHFSRSGLIHQLRFEGFTEAQAVHGANKAGL